MANEFIVRILVGYYNNSSNKPKWEKIFTYIKHFLPLFAPYSSDGNYVILSYSLINGVLKENIMAPHNLETYPSTYYYTDVRREGEGFMKRKGFYLTTEQARVILNRIEDFYRILFLNKMPDCISQEMIKNQSSLFERKPLYAQENPFVQPLTFKPLSTKDIEEAWKKAFGKENNSQIKPTNNMEKIKIDYVKKVVLSDTDAAIDAGAAVKHTAQRIDMCIMSKETEKSEKEMYIKSLEREYPLQINSLIIAKRELKNIDKEIALYKEIKSELGLSAN